MRSLSPGASGTSVVPFNYFSCQTSLRLNTKSPGQTAAAFFTLPRTPLQRAIKMQAEPINAPALATAPPNPAEEPSGMEAATDLLQAFSQVPSIAKGWAFPSAADGVRVTLQLSQRNLPANAQRKYLTQFQLSEAVLELGEADSSLPVDLRDALMVSPSPSGRRMLVVRPGKDQTSAILEVWDRSRALKEIHVPAAFHGKIYNDGWFGSGMAWCPDESQACYVAETPAATKTPEWGAAKTAEGKKVEGAAPKAWRGHGEFQEDWGELNTGMQPPALFVLNINSGEVAAVQGLPEGASCGQPQWSPDGKALLFVAWDHASANFSNFPQRLGIVFCFNRACALHAVAWPQQPARGASSPALRLAPLPLHSSFSPRFSPDGETLVMLSQAAAVDSGVHSATPALLALPWAGAVADAIAAAGVGTFSGSIPPPRHVIDAVWKPASEDDFPGLYCAVLPEQPFVGSGSTLVTTIQWRSNLAVVAVDLKEGTVQRLTPANGHSWSLVTAHPDWILASESHPGQPFKLYACHVVESQANAPQTWSWSRLMLPDAETLPPPVAAALKNIETQVLQVTPTVGAADLPFEVVVLSNKSLKAPQKTILTPHGGPHTCYSAQYFMPLSFLVASGYCVVLVNYRGSTGFGEASIQSLPGHIGTNDVADCMAALAAAVGTGHVDPARVAAVGGSHGGFLSSHLVGQHPQAFKAGVLRNPVCDISLMVHISDIPDWCFVEAWGTEKGRARAGAGPLAEDLQRFKEVSPVSHVGAVTAPILMMLGACDRRVPLDDGKRYLDALRSRADAPYTRLLVFPQDSHALDKPQTEFEQWVNALWWLERHV